MALQVSELVLLLLPFLGTFDLSFWNTSDCLSSMYLASIIISIILILSSSDLAFLEDLLLLPEFEEYLLLDLSELEET